MKVTATRRTYTMTFRATGQSYRLNSEEAQRVLDGNVLFSAKPNHVVLEGHNTSDSKQRVDLKPAALGGGPAFLIESD